MSAKCVLIDWRQDGRAGFLKQRFWITVEIKTAFQFFLETFGPCCIYSFVINRPIYKFGHSLVHRTLFFLSLIPKITCSGWLFLLKVLHEKLWAGFKMQFLRSFWYWYQLRIKLIKNLRLIVLLTEKEKLSTLIVLCFLVRGLNAFQESWSSVNMDISKSNNFIYIAAFKHSPTFL